MNWDMITALAVVIGTLAVVIALLYAALQIKEATRQRRIESYHAVLDEVDDCSKLLAEDGETSIPASTVAASTTRPTSSSACSPA